MKYMCLQSYLCGEVNQMFNKEKLALIINEYKKYFPEHWKDEMYKWQAIKHFQDN